MMTRSTHPTTRRTFVRGGLLLSLLAASPLRAYLVDDARADKNNGTNKMPPISERVKAHQFECESVGGGKLTVEEREAGTTTECNGVAFGGRTCFHTEKTTNCHQ